VCDTGCPAAVCHETDWLTVIDSGSQYGEVADECGDAYFWYGKALLEVARQEGGILGDAVPGGKQVDCCR